MGWDIKVENSEEICLITIRTINSRLWFVNNPKLDKKVLTYLARYREMHGVKLYAFVIMGNHYHMIAQFPRGNRAKFTKDFNARFTGIFLSTVKNFRGGKVWARPYRPQALPNREDVEEWFFYCALNPVSSGLVERIGEYTSYNSFVDSVSGRVREFTYVDWTEYNNRRRTNPRVEISEYTYKHELRFDRLPGYEDTTAEEYKKGMFAKLEERRQKIVLERKRENKGFAGVAVIRGTKAGSYPKTTKRSTRETPRPLVLTLCAETKRRYLEWYFGIVDAYKKCSKSYREGNLAVEFPPGTYRPPLLAT